MNRRTFFAKMALILLVTQLVLTVFTPGQAFAAIFEGFDARYIVEGGRLKIVLLEKGAATPRTRVGEWVRSGTADNGKIITFSAGTIQDKYRQDLSRNGDGTTFEEIRVTASSPGSGSWASNSSVKGDIEQPNVVAGYTKCSAQAETFSNNAQFDACVNTFRKENPDPSDDQNAADTEDPEIDNGCDVQLNNPLSWILCPVILALEEGVNAYYNAVDTALNFSIEGDRAEENFKGAWDAIRNIANVLFVIAFLFIIISQTLVGKL